MNWFDNLCEIRYKATHEINLAHEGLSRFLRSGRRKILDYGDPCWINYHALL